jgi:hypothetical protein
MIQAKFGLSFILSQNVPKFELYKHNHELFNIIMGFFMNFELLLILTFEEISIFSNGGHLGHRRALTDNFERGPPKDHSDKVCLKLAKWFLTRRFLNYFLLIYASKTALF